MVSAFRGSVASSMLLALGLTLVAAAAPPGPSTLERLAAAASREVMDAGFEPPLGLYVEGAPAPLERAFASVLAAQLADAHLAPVVIDATDATAAEQRARALGANSLLRVTLTLGEARLTARGDALSTWVNFWSGATPTRAGPAVALTASADIDAQVLALSGRPANTVAPLVLALSRLTTVARGPAALAIADLTGDGRGEILVLAGERVQALDASGSTRWSAALSGPLAARPCRDDFGAIAVTGEQLSVWSAKREKPELFSETGTSLGAGEVVQLDALAVLPQPGVNRFQPAITWRGKPLLLPAPPQALSVSGGVTLAVYADGTASLTRGETSTSRFGGVGTGSTLADLDGDGTPELIATTARTSGDADEVRVLPLVAAEAIAARGGLVTEAAAPWQQPLVGRAVTAARGDLDGDGREDVVLGVWTSDGAGALYVLRRPTP
jgi:hypothetical protein